MASETSLKIRRQLLEAMLELELSRPGAFLIGHADRSDPDRMPRKREAIYLKEKGWIRGQIGPDGGMQIQLTAAGRDYVEGGGFWRQPPASRADTYLGHLRDALADDESDTRAFVSQWAARARPYIRQEYPEHLGDFDSHVKGNRALIPGTSRTFIDGHDNFEEARASENSARARRIASYRERLLAFLDGLLALNQRNEEPQVPAPRGAPASSLPIVAPVYPAAMKLSVPKQKANDLLRKSVERAAALNPPNAMDPAFDRWERDTRAAFRNLFGEGTPQYDDFTRISFSAMVMEASPSESREAMKEGLGFAISHIEATIAEIETFAPEPQGVAADMRQTDASREKGTPTKMPNPRDVFIVHGRDKARVEFFFSFLRTLNLHPLDFQTLIDRSGSGSPYIGDIVSSAFREAHAIVVLFTGDDMAQMRPELLPKSGEDGERVLQPQPRPNVILEAGMALAINRNRTIIVEVPPLRGMSDLHGIHAVRFSSGDPSQRNTLANRLKTAGCPVETTGSAWLDLPFPSAP